MCLCYNCLTCGTSNCHGQELTVGLLLKLGFVKTAFALSSEFLYFDGLLQSLQVAQQLDLIKDEKENCDFRRACRRSQQMWQDLLQLVSSLPHVRGTADQPLASFCMAWLEKDGQSSSGTKILEIGRLAPEQLTQFLSVSPPTAQTTTSTHSPQISPITSIHANLMFFFVCSYFKKCSCALITFVIVVLLSGGGS